MTNEQIKTEFKNYLMERGAYKRFCKNLVRTRHSSYKGKRALGKVFNIYVDTHNKYTSDYAYIASAFVWSGLKVRGSYSYWRDMSRGWLSRIKRKMKQEGRARK